MPFTLNVTVSLLTWCSVHSDKASHCYFLSGAHIVHFNIIQSGSVRPNERLIVCGVPADHSLCVHHTSAHTSPCAQCVWSFIQFQLDLNALLAATTALWVICRGWHEANELIKAVALQSHRLIVLHSAPVLQDRGVAEQKKETAHTVVIKGHPQVCYYLPYISTELLKLS